MFDLFTYIIYLSLLAFVVIFTSLSTRIANSTLTFKLDSKLDYNHYIALIAISFVVGFRYYVGNDWEGYRAFFEYLKIGNIVYNVEVGFLLLNEIIVFIGGSYEWMFFVSAFIAWLFIFKSIDNKLLPLLLFFLFVDEYFFWSMNGVRQFIAISIFIYSTQFIISNKIYFYIFFIIIASLFHLSALLLIPLYFLPYGKLDNREFWLFLFLITLLIGNIPTITKLIEPLLINLSGYITLFSTYVRYFESDKFQAIELARGGGYFFRVIITIIIIYFSKDVVKIYPKTKIYFVLFFIGSVLQNLFFEYQLINRFLNYFLVFRAMSLAIITYYFWKNKKYQIGVIGLIVLYLIIYLTAIYNSSNMCSPYLLSFY